MESSELFELYESMLVFFSAATDTFDTTAGFYKWSSTFNIKMPKRDWGLPDCRQKYGLFTTFFDIFFNIFVIFLSYKYFAFL